MVAELLQNYEGQVFSSHTVCITVNYNDKSMFLAKTTQLVDNITDHNTINILVMIPLVSRDHIMSS